MTLNETGDNTYPLTNVTESGTITLTRVGDTDCERAFAQAIPVIVNENPILAINDPSAVCEPSTVDITNSNITTGSTGNGVLSYWTDVTATTMATGVTTIGTSSTVFIRSDNQGCTDIQPVTVTINEKPNLVITNPAAICAPGTVDITTTEITTGSVGGGNLTYWEDITAMTVVNNPDAVNTTTTLFIQAEALGCTDIQPVTVTITDRPMITNTVVTESICSEINTSGFVITSDIAGTNFNWISNGNNGASTSGTGNINSERLINTNLVNEEVRYTVTPTGPAPSNCVGDPVDFIVTVKPLPTITNDELTEEICSETSSDGFVLTSNLENTSYRWTSINNLVEGTGNNGNGDIPSQVLSTSTNDNNGTVVYTVTPTADGCIGESVDFTVDVFFRPEVNASFNGINPITVKSGTDFILAGFSTGGEVEWTSSDELQDAIFDPTDINSGVSTNELGGAFIVTLMSSNGNCTASDQVSVNIRLPILLPNAFTPNGDGQNDVYLIQGIETFPTATVRIYNRWGSLVYESLDNYLDNPWDGNSLKGKELPEGAYYYVVTVDDSDLESEENKSGAVNIIR